MVTHLFPVDANDYKGIFVFELAKELRHLGYDIHVVTPMRPGAKKYEVLDNITIHRYRFFGWSKGRQLGELSGTPILLLGSLIILGIIKCIITVTKYRIDLLHAYWVVPGGFIAVVSACLTGRPALSTAAGSDLNSASKNPVTKLFVRFTLKRLKHLIAVSSSLKEIAQGLGLPTQNGTVIPGPIGIDLSVQPRIRKRKRKNSSPVTLIYVGNLSKPKRIDVILKAVHAVQIQKVNVNLDIIGNGDLKFSLEEMAGEFGIIEIVRFLGPIPHHEVMKYLLCADIFVHCSEMEGLPVAIIEAMACGLPVVASNVGGIPDLVENGENGFLFDPEDVNGFAEGIIQLANNDNMRNTFSNRGREFVKNRLDRKKILSRLNHIYKEFLPSFKTDRS